MLWLIALMARRMWLLGSLHGEQKLSQDHNKLLGSRQVEPRAERSLLFVPNRIQSRGPKAVLRGDIGKMSDTPLFLRCYECQACADIQKLLFVGNSKSRDDVNEQYNMLSPAAKLIQRDCQASFFDGKYVAVQHLYETWKADKWQREFRWGYPAATCFDNSYEPGFKRYHLKWSMEFSKKIGGGQIIFTGMDRAKTDWSNTSIFRMYDLCLSKVLQSFTAHHLKAIAHASPSKHRFVVLINKVKGWRLYFLAQMFRHGLLNMTLYTLRIRPPPCAYYGAFFDERQGKCMNTSVPLPDPRALEFSHQVDPIVLSDDRKQNPLSEFESVAMMPRRNVHIILESEASSMKQMGEQFDRHFCEWTERVTEKTWLAIGYHHAFILIGTNLALDLLKAHGFKTFHPCINESYAGIAQPEAKQIAAMQEIKRLAALSEDEFDHVYETCLKPRAEFNYNHFHSAAFRQNQAKQRLWAWGMSNQPAFKMTDFRAKCDQAISEHTSIKFQVCRH